MVAVAVELAHLRPEIRELARLPVPERLAHVPANRWIAYSRASQAVALLNCLLASEPGRVRPRNLLVIGPTNNGKTVTAEHFLRTHPQHPSEDGEHEVIPVLLVQMRPSLTAAPHEHRSHYGADDGQKRKLDANRGGAGRPRTDQEDAQADDEPASGSSHNQ